MAASKRFDQLVGKQRARTKLREFIQKHIRSKRQAKVLCLPGEHGREIEEVYRKLGFQDKNIIGAEIDPAAAAGVREHYPRIHTFVGDVRDVPKRLVTVSPFAVVSLDYCGTFISDRLKVVYDLAKLGALAYDVVIATTFFVSRETTQAKNELKMLHIVRKASEGTLEDYMQAVKAPQEEYLEAARQIASEVTITGYLNKAYKDDLHVIPVLRHIEKYSYINDDHRKLYCDFMHFQLGATKAEHAQATERVSLGGGAARMTRQDLYVAAIELIKKGQDNDSIMEKLPITTGQLAALRAHLTRGTYK